MIEFDKCAKASQERERFAVRNSGATEEVEKNGTESRDRIKDRIFKRLGWLDKCWMSWKGSDGIMEYNVTSFFGG